tara:strand:- start:16 stop:255 length:240 start_codon:yes stop_codon:yes gene_type:complete
MLPIRGPAYDTGAAAYGPDWSAPEPVPTFRFHSKPLPTPGAVTQWTSEWAMATKHVRPAYGPPTEPAEGVFAVAELMPS